MHYIHMYISIDYISSFGVAKPLYRNPRVGRCLWPCLASTFGWCYCTSWKTSWDNVGKTP